MWSDEEGNNKLDLSNWPSTYMRTKFGGLGILNLQELNMYLIGSWIKRYIQDESTLWNKVVDSK
jgi:hypothetical protein